LRGSKHPKVFWFFFSKKNGLPYVWRMKFGVLGSSGRVGSLVAEEVSARGDTVARDGDWAGCAAIVDFTHPSRIEAHAAALTEAGIPWVLGTTGLTDDQQALVAQAATRIPIVQAANFSAGVTLVLEIARRLAEALPADAYDAEILESHHRQKIDAPSGTALALGRAVATGRGTPMLVREAQGARAPGAIGFASLRAGQVVGEHTLLFAGATEQIFLGHKALDRRMFAQGAVRAALWVQGRAPGLYDMTDVLGIRDAP
jgi:4-hydroxy-tetrahydrodipicolinate reductase